MSAKLHTLESVDWTFAKAATQGQTHGLHPYPAKFIPQIPRTLIQHLHPGDGSRVLDPFCGSGTTLVEAALAGVAAVGIDVHPLGCLMSKVKVTPLPSGALTAAAQAVVGRAGLVDCRPPVIPRLDHWFRPEVRTALARLVRAIDGEPDLDLRDALRVALSSIIVRVSNQESDTRYAAVEKNLNGATVPSLFLKAAESADAAIGGTWGSLFPPPPIQILNRDVLDVAPADIIGPVSLVVTSPPYPNAYEYWLYHKYRMYWLGMDPVEVRQREIGARPHYFKSDPQTAADFAKQMGQVFSLLAEVVVAGGHACFQIGTSVIRGELVDNGEILRLAAESNGFSEVARFSRRIPEVRKAFNPRHGRIRDETLLIFKR